MLYLSLGRISGYMVGDLRQALGRGGAPFGQYLLSDVLKNPLAARLQFFQSAWYLTEEQRAQLRAQRTTHPDLTRVWSWAPGYLSPKGADLGGVERLTGFKAKLLPPTLGVACATEEGLRRGLPKNWKTGGAEAVRRTDRRRGDGRRDLGALRGRHARRGGAGRGEGRIRGLSRLAGVSGRADSCA